MNPAAVYKVMEVRDLNTSSFLPQVLLSVETDTDEASEGEEDDSGPLPHVQYSGGPLRPSWVVV